VTRPAVARTSAADLPGLSLAALHPYLARQLPGVSADEPLQAQLLTGGRSNVTYRLAQGSRQWVLRRPPLGHVMPRGHDMGREHRVLTGLAEVGVPAPRPHLLCTDLDVIGAPFLVMEFVDGHVFGDAAATSHMSPTQAGAISGALVDTLVDVHEAPVRGTSLESLGRPEGFLRRQVELWLRQWEATRTRDVPGLEPLGHQLRAVVDDLGERPWSLVHGDYRLDNLIVSPAGHSVLAVLDWEMATLGDPVGDLALLLVYWTQPGDRNRRQVPVAQDVTSAPGFFSRRDVVERYAARRPVDEAHLGFCLGLACLKLAVVMESIWVRHLRGSQLGPDASDMREAAPALVRMGLDVAAGGGLDALSR
jgi:aminoglycoside phosphotransferase (APT) family kinase protein